MIYNKREISTCAHVRYDFFDQKTSVEIKQGINNG